MYLVNNPIWINANHNKDKWCLFEYAMFYQCVKMKQN